MAIQPVGDYDSVSKAEAAKRLRSGNVSVEEKASYVERFGEDFVKQAMSVDSTKYEISDDDFNDAKAAGKENAKDGTGYDGGKTGAAIIDAGLAAGSATLNLAGKKIGTEVLAAMGEKTRDKVRDFVANKQGNNAAKNLSDIATAILTSAVAAKYWLQKPNKEQHDAAMHLMQKEFVDGQSSLTETQNDLKDASEKVIELTEEAEDKNEAANDEIEEKKTMFDFYKQQYEALKAKKEAGGTLTADEKSLMRSLAPQMENAGTEINDISETTSEEVGELNDKIGDYEAVYDDSAEQIAEVEGVTDFAENFDENTRTMMYVEMAAQGINAASASTAAYRLYAKAGLSFGTTLVFAGMATAAAAASGAAMIQQNGWAKEMSGEIEARRDLQDLGDTTNEMYEEELDNYAGSIDVVEDLELEVPEDIEAPTTVASDTADTKTTEDDKDEDKKKQKEQK